jgi:hydroxypyruvate isomerase
MPRFSANISTLFTEVDMLDRFDAAARAGFKGVEIQFPYEWDKDELAERARRAAVEVVLCNLPAGDLEKGDRGMACVPARMSEFRDGVAKAREYARALGCKRLNCLAGLPPRLGDRVVRETFLSNVRYAAGELAADGSTLMIEAVNTRSVPGFYLRNSGQAFALINESGVQNLKMQFDVFHMQVMEGDLTTTIRDNIGSIGHFQVADVPDRHEPGTGEVNFPFLFSLVDQLGYEGWIGAEYVPAGRTEDGLGWLRPYLS